MAGDRRRGSLQNLVRTRTGSVEIDPLPLAGWILRNMRPSIISDYAGISTASWSTGTTGTGGTGDNCFYFHYTTPNQRTTSAEYIMQPIRWTLAAPEAENGDYDPVFKSPANSFVVHTSGQVSGSTNGARLGMIGISHQLLPVGSHAAWQNGYMTVQAAPQHSSAGIVFPPAAMEQFAEPTLQAIAPTTQVWNAYRGSQGGLDPLGYMKFHAVRHWINGSPVDDVRFDLPANTNDPKWRVPVQPGDTYQIDVWYKVKSTANAGNPAGPAKACVVIPTSRTSNGSEQPNVQWAQFGNVNFSPKFNAARQTYSVAVDGHVGWTLKDGNDGPHRMSTGDGWTRTDATGSSGLNLFGGIIWKKNVNDGHVRAIVLRYGRELAHVELYPGPLMGTPSSLGCVYYRIEDSNTAYRRQTDSAEYGTVYHASPGLFNQESASTFRLVPWSTSLSNAGINPDAEPGSFSASTVATGPVYSQLPTSITVRRR